MNMHEQRWYRSVVISLFVHDRLRLDVKLGLGKTVGRVTRTRECPGMSLIYKCFLYRPIACLTAQ